MRSQMPRSKTGGRKRGSLNKITTAAKETVVNGSDGLYLSRTPEAAAKARAHARNMLLYLERVMMTYPA